jgi:hypothetical protein
MLNLFRVFQNSMLNMSVDQYYAHCRRLKKNKELYDKRIRNFILSHSSYEVWSIMILSGKLRFVFNDIVPSMYNFASQTPFFWIDDIFNYGIVMDNILVLKYKEIHSEYVTYSKWTKLDCVKEMPQCHYLSLYEMRFR